MATIVHRMQQANFREVLAVEPVGRYVSIMVRAQNSGATGAMVNLTSSQALEFAQMVTDASNHAAIAP